MTYLLLLEIELTLIKLNNMTNFDIYYLTGVLVSVYMIWFYLIKLKRPVSPRHALLAIAGPLVWPAQIVKHIYDLAKGTAKY
jgi:hypothetical protein